MQKTDIKIDEIIIFSENTFTLIAGPCAVEDSESLIKTAEILKKNGLKILRGGTNKLRTSPHSFQGMGEKGAKLLSDIAKAHDLFTVTEITSISEIDYLNDCIDILLVGTRNMYNYQLLKEIGKLDKPIILKRGIAATVNEWLLAAEYIALGGNQKIILCERGIRTFSDVTRYTLDLASAVYITQNTPYHVITDPSHATGMRELIKPMVLASKVSGLQGSMIEIHPDPDKALSDGHQMIDFACFEQIIQRVLRVES